MIPIICLKRILQYDGKFKLTGMYIKISEKQNLNESTVYSALKQNAKPFDAFQIPDVEGRLVKLQPYPFLFERFLRWLLGRYPACRTHPRTHTHARGREINALAVLWL